MDAHTLTVTEGFELSNKLSLWYGTSNLADNPELFKAQVTRLAAAVDARLAGDSNAASSGCIINTCGWIDGGGYELLTYILSAFKVNVVLVMGHDRLYQQLLKTCTNIKTADGAGGSGGAGVTVVKLPRSGGVVQRDERFRNRLRSTRVKEYFYGRVPPPPPPPSATSGADGMAPPPARSGMPPPLPLSPFPIELKFSKVKLWAHVGRSQQMNGAAANIDGLMPVVGAAAKDPTMLQRTKPSVALLHTLLAVHHFTPPTPASASSAAEDGAAEEDEETRQARALAASNVAGYVVVQDVSLERQTIAVLAPSPAALPSLHLVCGTVKWLEH